MVDFPLSRQLVGLLLRHQLMGPRGSVGLGRRVPLALGAGFQSLAGSRAHVLAEREKFLDFPLPWSRSGKKLYGGGSRSGLNSPDCLILLLFFVFHGTFELLPRQIW